MIKYYPNKTNVSVKMESVIKHKDKWAASERMSARMIQCAASLDTDSHIGWQISVPVKGLAEISLFGSEEVSESDLCWIGERTGNIAKTKTQCHFEKNLSELYELYLPVMENDMRQQIGFSTNKTDYLDGDNVISMWPSYFTPDFNGIITAMRESGAVFRATFGSADLDEQKTCVDELKKTFDVGNITVKDYARVPIRARFLLLLPGEPTLKLKAILKDAFRGAGIRHLGTIDDHKTSEQWDNPLRDSSVYPDCAACVMMLEPDIKEPVIGIRLIEEPAKKMPASHKDTKSRNAVVIGKATDISGIKRRISIGETDLKRHYQIIGQTGTGKSTLIANMILSAIQKGYGLTFFDPHGTTIDVILRSIPEKYAHKVRVVRVGDSDNPVPLNIWDSDDFEKEERNINDLCELFSDIFDPKREGFVGPRYERWLSTFCKASLATLGRRASLESIAVISQSKDNMFKACKVFADEYPGLAESIKQEYGLDESRDFHEVLSWYLCKFQRLTSVEQMRKTLGAGANALNFNSAIDTDTVTLIDLASPAIGAHAARIIGTLTMMKLWNAALQRQRRDLTHLVVVDEASLFQTNPMPRMLAEGRKFGISMVLCHQHTGQLTQEIRDALEANSANLSAFRVSPKDAENASTRFDKQDIKAELARVDAFNAITTLSVDGVQTAPFTLEISRPKKQKNGEYISAMIEQRSIDTLVKPFKRLRALTAAEISEMLNDPEKLRSERRNHNTVSDPPSKSAERHEVASNTEPIWLKEWKYYSTKVAI